MHQFSDWIQSQNRVGDDGRTYPCCSVSDGRPLNDDELRVRDGHYEFLFSKAHWGEDEGTDEWVQIPDDRILHRANPVGYPIVWAKNYGLQVRVYCAILTGGV